MRGVKERSELRGLHYYKKETKESGRENKTFSGADGITGHKRPTERKRQHGYRGKKSSKGLGL